AVALIAYIALGNAPRAEAQRANATSRPWRVPEERDQEFVKRREEFIQTFLGRGPHGVSPKDYAAALAAARALPPSPLLPQTGWISPIPPPIQNDYSGDGTARIQAIAIDPINTNVVYTGSFGGLAKTTDGGSTWQYLSDTWASQSIGAIAIDYNSNSLGSNNYIYVGTSAGIYRSFDGGATWSGPFGANYFFNTQINAIATTGSGLQRNATVYVAFQALDNSYYGALYRSTDSGSTWDYVWQRPSYPKGIWDVAKDPWSSAIYVTDYDGVEKSTDSGQTWTNMFSAPASKHSKLRLITQPGTLPSSSLYF